jgi:signal transduction histidine kinase
MKDNRRKTVLINKRFQLALIAKFLLVNVFILTLFGLFLYFFFNSEIEANLYSAHVVYHNMKDMLLPIIITLSLLNILISSVIITLFVLFASFRIAGPLYRFNAAINEINQGNLKPLLTLREKDELYPFSESLRYMVNHFIQAAERSKQITSELKSINQKVNNEALTEKIAELESLLLEVKY